MAPGTGFPNVSLSPLHRKGTTSCFSDKNYLPKETKKRSTKGKKQACSLCSFLFGFFRFFRPYLFCLRPKAALRRQGSSGHPQCERARAPGTIAAGTASGFLPAQE
jgi:hypothetical protein